MKQNIKRQKDIIETKEEVGKVKDMLKENSAFKGPLRRKLEAEDEIEKDEPKEKEKVIFFNLFYHLFRKIFIHLIP